MPRLIRPEELVQLHLASPSREQSAYSTTWIKLIDSSYSLQWQSNNRCHAPIPIRWPARKRVARGHSLPTSHDDCDPCRRVLIQRGIRTDRVSAIAYQCSDRSSYCREKSWGTDRASCGNPTVGMTVCGDCLSRLMSFCPSSGNRFPSSDFLVVSDPNGPSHETEAIAHVLECSVVLQRLPHYDLHG
jgi:hypothetical protein